MRRYVLVAVVLCGIVLPLCGAELKLGKPIDLKTSTSVRELLSNPDKYVGKRVKVEGEIVEVCQNMGCWITVKDASSAEPIRIKVNDGEIVFPKDGAGRKAIAQGTLQKLDTAGKTSYQIKGDGAEIE